MRRFHTGKFPRVISNSKIGNLLFQERRKKPSGLANFRERKLELEGKSRTNYQQFLPAGLYLPTPSTHHP